MEAAAVPAACGDPTSGAEVALTATLVVPSFNRKERLRRLLVELEREHLAGSSFDVVVAVDGSTDGTLAMLAELRLVYPLHIVSQANAGPAAARNHAIEHASGEVLIFLDDDVLPVTGLIERHLAVHRCDPRVVVMGPMLPPPQRRLPPWLRWEAAMLQKQYDAMVAGLFKPTPRQFYTGNASARREHVLAAGGFDHRFKRAEDVELAYRLRDSGLHFAYLPDAVVLHEPDRTFAGWLRVPFEYGCAAVFMARSCDRDDDLTLAREEWHERHPLNRLVLTLCVGRRRRTDLALKALQVVARLSGVASLTRLERAGYSALFGMQYWQGVASASGGAVAPWREDAARTHDAAYHDTASAGADR